MPSLLPDVSIGRARDVLQLTDRLIKTVPEVESVHGKLGRAETATDPAPVSMVETVIRLKPRDEWRPGVTLEGLKAELRSEGHTSELPSIMRNSSDVFCLQKKNTTT